MSEIMNGDEINEIERYIPSGNPDALHRPLRNVVASHRALQAKVRELEERLTTLKQQRIKYGPICLVCGAAEPCHLKDDPHSPCTFDPAPRELWDRCKEQKQRISELEERLVDYDAAASECEGQSVLTTLHALKQYGMQLEREKADLEVKLRQVEQERDLWEHRAQEAEQAYFAYTDDLRVLANERDQLEQERNELQEYIAKQPDAEASITRLEQDNAALRAELAYSREREEMHSQLRQDNHQEMLRLGSETIALRARVERLESALRHIAEARWSPRTTASYDEDARYAYPERESYVRQYAQRALEGKEEHGTRRDE